MIPGELVSLLARRRLVAEIRTETAVQALGVVEALAAGGITAMEVSLTIPGAQEILSHLALRQDALIGAGGVLDAQQARDAISAGARFIASPICASDVVPVCRDAHVACVLGALTPTEVMQAHRAGADMVKLIPVEVMGGPQYVQALMRQLPHIGVQVAGEMPLEALGAYLRLPVRTLCLGTVLVPPALVDRGNWQAITVRARTFAQYAMNPHAYAAQFLAAANMALDANAGAVPAAAYTPSYTPGQTYLPVQRAAIAAVPTMPATEGSGALVESALAQLNAAGQTESDDMVDAEDEYYEDEPSARSAAVPADDFRPWDSRPVKLGDEEDWLR